MTEDCVHVHITFTINKSTSYTLGTDTTTTIDYNQPLIETLSCQKQVEGACSTSSFRSQWARTQTHLFLRRKHTTPSFAPLSDRRSPTTHWLSLRLQKLPFLTTTVTALPMPMKQQRARWTQLWFACASLRLYDSYKLCILMFLTISWEQQCVHRR